VRREDRRDIAAQALAKVGLGDKLDSLPNQMSGGQKQRVAIARAMINRPRILLADEPTGALDQKTGAQVMELFEQLNDEGTTLLMITHDVNVAARARKTLYIVDGRLGDSLEGTGWNPSAGGAV